MLQSIYEDKVEANPQWLAGASAVKWHIRIRIGTRVRPLSLVVHLPESYPLHEPPTFSIVADWLGAEDTTALGGQLVRVCVCVCVCVEL